MKVPSLSVHYGEAAIPLELENGSVLEETIKDLVLLDQCPCDFSECDLLEKECRCPFDFIAVSEDFIQ